MARLVKTVNGEDAGFCTVFKVGEDLAMTAGHCCTDAKDAEEEWDDEHALDDLFGVETEKPKAFVVAYHATGTHAIPGASFEVLVDDDKHDVCVLRGKLRGAPLHLAAHDPDVGAPVWTAGYPKTVFLISSGHWSGRDDDGEAVASVAVWGGASGSPILDEDSRVVGILRAFYPPMSNMAVIAPVEWVRTSYLRAHTR